MTLPKRCLITTALIMLQHTNRRAMTHVFELCLITALVKIMDWDKRTVLSGMFGSVTVRIIIATVSYCSGSNDLSRSHMKNCNVIISSLNEHGSERLNIYDKHFRYLSFSH